MTRENASETTTDRRTIQEWCERRDGKPSTVSATASADEPGILRINFPGYAEEGLEEVSWDEFFEKFNESNLAFVYQERTADGELSRFCKFVEREN